MHYGLELPAAGVAGDARTLGDLAQLAEDAGWDGVFLEDYIVWQGQLGTPTYDPWVALAAMALRTERIRLGTMVTPLARRRPWKLACETVTLDHLSHGRLILGVGLGDTTDVSLTAFGEEIDVRQRSEMLDEALEVLIGLWSGQPFSYHGAHYHVQEVILTPTPVQQPRIPIWVGGSWPRRGVIRRAARWDGFVGGKVHAEDEDWHLTPAEVASLRADIARQRSNTRPWDLALGGGPRSPDLEHERALIQSMAEAGATWWMEYIYPELGGLEGMRNRIKGGPVRID
jgi:alkanesulfonate monooxygenase SsuD/methylene tetrahydromethanopterin reductase-like flavin-dependent oxidoreductase (luciferase family)